METFRSAPQDHRVSGLEAKRARVGGDVGAGFVDDADDAQGRAHPFDVKAARAVPFGDDFAHGIILRGDRAKAVANALDAGLVKHQTVEHGIGKALFAAKHHILPVRGDNFIAARPDRIGGGVERLFLGGGGRKGKLGGGGLGLCADFLHDFSNVERVFHGRVPLLLEEG